LRKIRGECRGDNEEVETDGGGGDGGRGERVGWSMQKEAYKAESVKRVDLIEVKDEGERLIRWLGSTKGMGAGGAPNSVFQEALC
jgi:hypothetical protein